MSEVIIQSGPNPLLPDTDLRWLALEQVHRHMSNHPQIVWCIASTNPTRIFPKRHIQPPMQLILHAPVRTHRLVKGLNIIDR